MSDINFLKTSGMSFQDTIEFYYSKLDRDIHIILLENQLEKIKADINHWHAVEKTRKHVQKLLTRYQPAQLSKEWFDIRSHMLSASSDIGAITGFSYTQAHSPKNNDKGLVNYHINKALQSKEIEQLILKKCGQDKNKFVGNEATRFGSKFEEIASRIYQHKTKQVVLEFGLLQHPNYSFVGASPDGITPDGIMLEIKCPMHRKITGVVPSNYWCQMQVQMEVADLDNCDFVECKFIECSREECMEDHPTYKGCIGEMYRCSCDDFTECGCYSDLSNRVYIYSNVSNTVARQIDSVKTQYMLNYAHKYKYRKNIYWVLKTFSLVRVTRDCDWWNNNIKNIETVWESILEHRNNKDKLNELMITHMTPSELLLQDEYNSVFE
jgi:putative phage-type endonuclease